MSGNQTIGEHCYFGPHVTLGTRAFTFRRDEQGRPILKPQTHGVTIGDHVMIFAHANVDRGTDRDTVIGSYSVLDHYVHFGHDAICGESVIICAQVFVGGFVEIGDQAYLGAQCAIKPRVKIGHHAKIGMGAIVTRDVPPGAIVRGDDPAKVRGWQAGYQPDGWERDIYGDM